MKINAENFADTVKNTKGLMVIDFWAEWCGPCKMLAPVIEEVKNEMPDVLFEKINIDEEVEIALTNKISSIPTLMFVKDGEIVKKTVGYLTKEELVSEIDGVR